ncbi:hypothetical protein V498_09266 [Pseudogymnoascus sp. VKM F-4517 (FW-2822)]|nr:hypothetical protein V498_09266 [Pseudogymnoascus sp. VKM F-4517 (FW-2822)]
MEREDQRTASQMATGEGQGHPSQAKEAARLMIWKERHAVAENRNVKERTMGVFAQLTQGSRKLAAKAPSRYSSTSGSAQKLVRRVLAPSSSATPQCAGMSRLFPGCVGKWMNSTAR